LRAWACLAHGPSARHQLRDRRAGRDSDARTGRRIAIELDRPFDTILIDNPDVVDVRALNDQLIVLEPLNLGASNVLFVDEHNIAIANIRVVVCDPRRDRAAIVERIYAGRPVPSFRRHAT
jgi:Flp pilus assembly secretin CpaC